MGKNEWDNPVNSNKKYTNIAVFPKDLKEVSGENPETNELDALNMAMESEKEAIDYYSQIKEKIQDKETQEIINEIIKQEKDHYQILLEEFNHLSKTGYWYQLDIMGG